MKIIIREKEFEYDSDFLSQKDKWFFAGGDYFRFPIYFGQNKCFIKRFEQKKPSDISGWAFMNDIKGKYEKNLPRLHDIKSEEENGKTVYYVFYDLLDGVTLNRSSTATNLANLLQDLLNGLNSIHKYNFWVDCFCEENIFCNNNGQFFLVDLDSVQPTSKLPGEELFGAKDYKIAVSNYYKYILNYKDFKTSEIKGPLLNKFELIFLILNVRISVVKGKTDYMISNPDFHTLPSILNNISPSFKDFFQRAYTQNQFNNEIELEEEIKRLITKEVINNTLITIPAGLKSNTIINEFSSSKSIVQNNEPFILNYRVENAETVELYKNRALEKTLAVNETSVELKETTHDGKNRVITYQLLVYGSHSKIKSNEIVVTVSESNIITATPVIELQADKEKITSGESFTLHWKQEGAKSLELYKNENYFREIDVNINDLEVSERAFDGKIQTIKYELVAKYNDTFIRSNPVFITVNPLTSANLLKENDFTTKTIVLEDKIIATEHYTPEEKSAINNPGNFQEKPPIAKQASIKEKLTNFVKKYKRILIIFSVIVLSFFVLVWVTKTPKMPANPNGESGGNHNKDVTKTPKMPANRSDTDGNFTPLHTPHPILIPDSIPNSTPKPPPFPKPIPPLIITKDSTIYQPGKNVYVIVYTRYPPTYILRNNSETCRIMKWTLGGYDKTHIYYEKTISSIIKPKASLSFVWYKTYLNALIVSSIEWETGCTK